MVRDGYTMTELGEIPGDWEIVKVNDILELLTDFEANGGFAQLKENVHVYDKVNYAWYVRATDLENKTPLNNVKYVDESSYRFLRKTELFGDEVLLTKRGEIGKVYFFKKVKRKATLAPNLYLLKINSLIYSKYLYYYFISDIGQRELSVNNDSTTLGALYKDAVKSLRLPLPPLPEQQIISTVISSVDETIEHTEALIEKYRHVKKGLMSDLLSKGIDEEGRIRSEDTHEFKDSLFGRVPVDWSVQRIGECLNLKGGSTPSTNNKNYWGGNIHWAVPTDITKLNSKYIADTDRKITDEGLSNCSSSLLPKGCVLLTSRATIGFLAINETEITTNQGFINILPSEEVMSLYLYYFLSYIKNKLVQQAYGSTFLELSKNTFKKFHIPIPPLTEQERIAEILTSADQRIEKEEAYRDKLLEIKNGLMQDLLTGKVRVTV